MNKKNCMCKGKSQKDSNCPVCGVKKAQEHKCVKIVEGNGLLDCLDWSKLKTLLVFTAGSFLTMRMALVAAELG